MTTLSRCLAEHPNRPEWSAAVVAALAVVCLLDEVAARLARATFRMLSGRGETFGLPSPVVRRPVRVIRAGVTVAAAALCGRRTT